MRGRGRVGAAFTVTVAALAAGTGCGIRPTGVVGAGTGPQAAGAAVSITVYLVQGDRAWPRVRPGLPGHPDLGMKQLSIDVPVQERRDGFRTLIGRQLSTSVTGDVAQVWETDGAGPGRRTRWTRLAMAQVVCTANAVPGVKEVRPQIPEWGGPFRLNCADFTDLTS
ncbi:MULTISPECIES: hypothetical protein [Thermomonosporaceae]|uniref:hypothetical protein n=1 Tax=Thermomonosporaceae TaxID=2012 RepID=UPI00255A71A7|nr:MULTISPECIES: hypothetical protein [Thermomonosporaceae]MDL4771275.1 hypothetical protein [Actinomadura xylanilytica]